MSRAIEKAKFWLKLAEGFFPGICMKCTPCKIFSYFFGLLNWGIAQTAEPLFTWNTSKDMFLHKEGPFGGLNNEKLCFPLYPPISGDPVMHFL